METTNEQKSWWANKGNAERIPGELQALVRNAFLADAWVYQRSTRNWYTPEEFERAMVRWKDRKREANEADFVVANPWSGLRVEMDYLERRVKSLRNFAQRLEDYFELKKRGK